MTTSAPYFATGSHSNSVSFAEPDFGAFQVSPHDRIGQPVRRRRNWLWMPLLMALTTGGWFLVDDRSAWVEWASAQLSVLVTATQSQIVSGPAPAASETRHLELAARSDPRPEPALGPSPFPAAGRAASGVTENAESLSPGLTAATDSPAAETEKTPLEPLPPPTVDPADPYQQKAVAVGLHPELSRVLLERLSPSDYRNAGHAIRTALSETPDDAVFVWPRVRKPELALFQVGFVPGASGDCRRYVVKVTKDGWLTTALPMEKCGVKPTFRDASANRAPPTKPSSGLSSSMGKSQR